MTADIETLEFYNAEATAYATNASGKPERVRLKRFADKLAPETPVLDFGCGSGWAAHAFSAQGFPASAFDGSSGLLAEAGFPEVAITIEQSAGYDAINTGMMHILARREG